MKKLFWMLMGCSLLVAAESTSLIDLSDTLYVGWETAAKSFIERKKDHGNKLSGAIGIGPAGYTEDIGRDRIRLLLKPDGK